MNQVPLPSSSRRRRILVSVALCMLCAVLCSGEEKSVAMTPRFQQTIFIGKPAAEVWAALTTKTVVDRYYMAPLLALELRKGGRIAYGRESAMIEGALTELDPPRKLSHNFRFATDPGPETLVTYEIEPVGDAMSALHVIHSGFTTDNQTFADVTTGWPIILSSLKTLLETGHPLPWPKD